MHAEQIVLNFAVNFHGRNQRPEVLKLMQNLGLNAAIEAAVESDKLWMLWKFPHL